MLLQEIALSLTVELPLLFARGDNERYNYHKPARRRCFDKETPDLMINRPEAVNFTLRMWFSHEETEQH